MNFRADQTLEDIIFKLVPHLQESTYSCMGILACQMHLVALGLFLRAKLHTPSLRPITRLRNLENGIVHDLFEPRVTLIFSRTNYKFLMF